MEELAKALAEAVRAGSQLAGPAIVGYYIVRVVEVIAGPLAFTFAVLTAGKTVRFGMSTFYDRQTALLIEERKTAEVKHMAYMAELQGNRRG